MICDSGNSPWQRHLQLQLLLLSLAVVLVPPATALVDLHHRPSPPSRSQSHHNSSNRRPPLAPGAVSSSAASVAASVTTRAVATPLLLVALRVPPGVLLLDSSLWSQLLQSVDRRHIHVARSAGPDATSSSFASATAVAGLPRRASRPVGRSTSCQPHCPSRLGPRLGSTELGGQLPDHDASSAAATGLVF